MSIIRDIKQVELAVVTPSLGLNVSRQINNYPVYTYFNHATYNLTGRQLRIASTSADDAAAGIGARIIRIEGIALISGVYQYFYEDVTLNGLTPVLTTQTAWYRVNKAFVISSGSAKASVNTPSGNIAITDGTTTIPYAQILAGRVGSGNGIFTVPDNYIAILEQFNINHHTSSASSSGGIFRIVRYDNDYSNPFTGAPERIYQSRIFNTYGLDQTHNLEIRFEARNDIEFQIENQQNGATVTFNALFQLIPQ